MLRAKISRVRDTIRRVWAAPSILHRCRQHRRRLAAAPQSGQLAPRTYDLVARSIYPPPMDRAGQLRVQGAFFAFLTIFFAGITAAAFHARVWVIAVAGAALTLWMASVAIRTLRAARHG
jgi:hypothetical protein